MTLTLYAADGYGVRINNLETWGGLMGPDHDYFERGNLDIFSGKGPCLSGPACLMNITSDGSGSGHGWYCNYVEVTNGGARNYTLPGLLSEALAVAPPLEVTTTGAHIPCAQQLFTVEQWIALDRSPYQLTAIRDLCDVGREMLKGLGTYVGETADV
ncbi:PLAT domain-containing protein 3 [Daucus carota subsp. sativus]|uniref:PLAT domain-containing protein 3 n=1 Tax=Daucus carota subsp. sativus TaxID=79200 RepID=UPI00308292C6